MTSWHYGFHPVREALRRGAADVVRVLVSRNVARGRGAEIRRLCEARAVAVSEVSESELDRLAAGVHNGFAIELEDEGASESMAETGPDTVVLVEDVQDPRNLGALIRVCDAAGVSRLLVRDRGSAPIGATAAKTSAGAAEWLPVERITNSANEIARLKDDGYWVYGAVPGGEAPWDLDLTGRVAICVGGEEKGLRRRTRELCDGLVGLPMGGRVESLNLSTAAAAILFDIVRQRGA